MNERILEQAADWLDRIHELNDKEKQQLCVWLQTPENRQAFDKMVKVFADPDIQQAINQLGQQSQTQHVIGLDNKKAKHTQPWSKFAVAASLSAIILSSYWIFSPDKTANQVVTQIHTKNITKNQSLNATVGKRVSKLLDDGTYVHLNANSQLTATLTGQQRKIKLNNGQIFLDVAKDKTRPFVIDSGEVLIKVLGTSFEVDRVDNNVAVTVYEGRVEIIADETVVLVPPQRAVLKNGQLIKVENAQLTQLPSWRTGWVEAEGQALFKVIQQLQRYSQKTIVVDPSLTHKLISGRFKLETPLESLTLIAATYNWQLTDKNNQIQVKPK